MKVLKLTILTILFGFSINTKAQDASNNATWEETVEFLTDFIRRFNGNSYEINENLEINDLLEYYINNDIFFAGTKRTSIAFNGKPQKYNYLSEVKLNDLYGVEILKKNIKLIFVKNSVKQTEQIRNETNYKDVVFISLIKTELKGEIKSYIVEPNSKTTKRLLKAFQHLAYLAGEKRKNKKSKF